MRRGIFCLAGVGLKRICPFCPDTGEVQEYVFIIKIAQPAAVVHRKHGKKLGKSRKIRKKRNTAPFGAVFRHAEKILQVPPPAGGRGYVS